MRVAALYDIHGNLPALDAVLDDIARQGVDVIVSGGDVVPGPMPRQCLERLLSLTAPTRFISGNGDREVVNQIRGIESPTIPDAYRDVMRWNAQEVQPEYEPVLANWPATTQFDIPGLGEVLFCHATLRNDMDIFLKTTPEERLLPIFAEAKADVIVCGHTHMQFDRMVGKMRVVNAGSVGMPFAEPGAYWLLLDGGVQFKKTTYDFEAAAAQVRATAYPQAELFAGSNILKPPAEQAMLEAFAKASI